MQTYVLNVLAAALLLLLSGCQSTTTTAPIGGLGAMFNPYPSGATLAQSVQSALEQSGDPVLAQVHVESTGNMVILSGYVKKIRQSDSAEQIAHDVSGVQMVKNNLIVRQ